MLVLVNSATRFSVAIYQVKRKDLKNAAEMMKTAISNTLLSMNLNPELVSEYMNLLGEVEFISNRDRQKTAWVIKAGLNCTFHVGRKYNDTEKIFCDTLGIFSNRIPVNHSGGTEEWFVPYQLMIEALSELTVKQPFKYRAFELLVTLDLEVYQAIRRIVVPADLELEDLHKVMQSVFSWKNNHLYDLIIFDNIKGTPVTRLVSYEDDFGYNENCILMEGHTLSEFFPEYKNMVYTYDMGDNWKHEIQFIREIEEFDEESPYLVEAIGQIPPEDIGGVGGFMNFREIMLDPSCPEYREMMEWAGFWEVELNQWKSRPRVIQV